MKLFKVSILALATAIVDVVASALSPSSEVHERANFSPNALLACGALKVVYGSQVFFPGQANYTAENQREFFYSIAELQLYSQPFQ